MEKLVIGGVVLVGFGFSFIFGGMLGAVAVDCGAPVKCKTPKPVVETVVEYRDDVFLRENACILYDNWEGLYEGIVEQCNTYGGCKPSDLRTGRETYESFDEFYNLYCRNEANKT